MYLGLAFAFIARSSEHSTREHASVQDTSRTIIFLVVVGASLAAAAGVHRAQPLPASERPSGPAARIENGKYVEHWGGADNLDMIQQVGVVITPK